MFEQINSQKWQYEYNDSDRTDHNMNVGLSILDIQPDLHFVISISKNL